MFATLAPKPPVTRAPRTDLPARPEEIDMDRIVDDPDYRKAVQRLLKRWGVTRPGPKYPDI